MTRFAKEMMRRGVKLEHQYDTLPTDFGLETVVTDPENARVKFYHVSAGWSYLNLGRDGSLEYSYPEEVW